ncbi:hypothetical protein GCM10017687_79570 [Streptomyces echinatus]
MPYRTGIFPPRYPSGGLIGAKRRSATQRLWQPSASNAVHMPAERRGSANVPNWGTENPMRIGEVPRSLGGRTGPDALARIQPSRRDDGHPVVRRPRIRSGLAAVLPLPEQLPQHSRRNGQPGENSLRSPGEASSRMGAERDHQPVAGRLGEAPLPDRMPFLLVHMEGDKRHDLPFLLVKMGAQLPVMPTQRLGQLVTVLGQGPSPATGP